MIHDINMVNEKKKRRRKLNHYVVDVSEVQTIYVEVDAFSKADAVRRIKKDLETKDYYADGGEFLFDKHCSIGEVEMLAADVGEEEKECSTQKMM